MNMPRITLITAQALILVGGFGYIMSQAKTALIPAFLGALLGIFGMLATKEKLRMHAMHGAALVGLLIIGGTARSIPGLFELLGGAEVERPLAIKMQALTFFIGVVYMGFSINSFIQARRARKAAEG